MSLFDPELDLSGAFVFNPPLTALPPPIEFTEHQLLTSAIQVIRSGLSSATVTLDEEFLQLADSVRAVAEGKVPEKDKSKDKSSGDASASASIGTNGSRKSKRQRTSSSAGPLPTSAAAPVSAPVSAVSDARPTRAVAALPAPLIAPSSSSSPSTAQRYDRRAARVAGEQRAKSFIKNSRGRAKAKTVTQTPKRASKYKQ